MAVSKAFLFLSTFLRKFQVRFQKISSRTYLSSLKDLPLLHFSCSFPLPLLVSVRPFRYWCLSFET
ncbi:hypothetical protein YC2023_010599 [Brassica napus]